MDIQPHLPLRKSGVRLLQGLFLNLSILLIDKFKLNSRPARVYSSVAHFNSALTTRR